MQNKGLIEAGFAAGEALGPGRQGKGVAMPMNHL